MSVTTLRGEPVVERWQATHLGKVVVIDIYESGGPGNYHYWASVEGYPGKEAKCIGEMELDRMRRFAQRNAVYSETPLAWAQVPLCSTTIS